MTLAAHEVSVTRGSAALVKSVSLTVRPGEFVVVIGPNGAGKSTLLHALSGATRPTRGYCHLDGVALADWSPAALARRRSVLPQAPALGFPLTVSEVVALGRSPHAGHADQMSDWRAINTALATASIAHLAERSYPELSGGERQRVHLARVLAQIEREGRDEALGARYMLLDEPTNNLDLSHQQRLVATAAHLAARGDGVLAILHDPNLAAQYADRLVVLADGAVYANGVPESVLTQQIMGEVFDLKTVCLTHPRSGRPYVLPG